MSKFYLPGRTCMGCKDPVEKALNEYFKQVADGVKPYGVYPGVRTLELNVILDDTRTEESLIKHLEAAGIKLSKTETDSVDVWQWVRGGVGIGGGLLILILGLSVGTLPLFANILIAAIAIPLTLALGWDSYRAVLIELELNSMDSLYVISTLTIIAVSLAAVFIPWLPMMFDAGLLIFGFHHLGLGIKSVIKTNMLFKHRFIDRMQDYAKYLRVGAELSIKPGEMIPLNSNCKQDCFIDESIKSGSAIPVKIKAGEILLAGTYNRSAEVIQLKVVANAENSYLAHLDQMLAEAKLSDKAELEDVSAELLRYFVPAVIIISLLSAIIIAQFFTFALALQCAISVLVSACPCTLGLVIPTALDLSMKHATEDGIFFKDHKSLEAAGKVGHVVFDLNGTLTQGKLQVKSCELVEGAGFDEARLKSYAHALESASESQHPFAIAIIKHTTKSVVSGAQPQPGSLKIHSNGVSAVIAGKCYTIGNDDMMSKSNIKLPAAQVLLAGDHQIFLAENNVVVGWMILHDPLRPEAKVTVAKLKEMGMKLSICTGTDRACAKRYAKELGIGGDDIKCGMQPQDKIKYIESLKNNFKVAFIGDGSNDAGAMAKSAFSIALKSHGGNEVTQGAAGAVIGDNNSLQKIVHAFEISQTTIYCIKQNLILSLAYNLSAMFLSSALLLTFGIMLNPGVGVALMCAQAVLLLLNTWRLCGAKATDASAEITAPHSKGGFVAFFKNTPSQATAQDLAPSLSI